MFKKFLVQNGGRGLPFFWPDGTTGFLRKYKEKHSRFFLFSSYSRRVETSRRCLPPLFWNLSALLQKNIFYFYFLENFFLTQADIFTSFYSTLFFVTSKFLVGVKNKMSNDVGELKVFIFNFFKNAPRCWPPISMSDK
jgi:hypothetical protein